MSDFEIEGSDEEQSPYGYSPRPSAGGGGGGGGNANKYQSNNYSNPYGSGNNFKSQQQKRKGGFDDDEDEDVYDFDYEENVGNKGKGLGKSNIAAFSPAAKSSGSDRHATFSDDSYNQGPAKGGNNLRLSTVSNESSALDRAKNIMDRYSNKNFSAPKSNFKGGRAKHFDEDDISIDDEEEEEEDDDEDFKHQLSADIEISESDNHDHPPPRSTQIKAPATTNVKSASSTHTTNLNASAPISSSLSAYNQPKKEEKPYSSKLIDESAVYSEYNESVPEESFRELEESAIPTEHEDEEEYSNEEFDEVEEVNELDESVADLDKAREAVDSRNKEDIKKIDSKNIIRNREEGDDDDDEKYDDFEDENASYSRIVYDRNEDNESASEEEEESEDNVMKSSKSKILSFADLAEFAGWDPVQSADNNASRSSHKSSPEPIPVVETASKTIVANSAKPLTQVISTLPERKSDATSNSRVQNSLIEANGKNASASTAKNQLSLSVKKDEPIKQTTVISQPLATIVLKSSNSTQENQFSTIHRPEVGSALPQSTPIPSITQPVMNAPELPTAQNPLPQPSQTQSTPTYPAPPTQPYYQAPPPSYQPPPYAAPLAGQTAAHSSPPAYSPYQQPYQYPYPYQPPPTHRSYPYNFPYPPAYPPAYPPGYQYTQPYPYAYPPGYYPPPPPLHYGQPPVYPPYDTSSTFSPNPNSVREVQQQKPIIFELIQELQTVQAEANWAKAKLAETILFMKTSGLSSTDRGLKTSNSTSQAALSNDKKSSKMEEDENDDDEDYSEYSEDFETSQLNTSSGSHRRGVPSPKKPTRNVSQSWKSLPKLSEEPILPVQDHQKIIEDQILELLRRESRAAYKPPPPELSTGDPITDSVAKSFLASQELLRTKLDSLRLRLQMTATNPSQSMYMQSPELSTTAKSNLQPSLSDIKNEFELRRKQHQERMLEFVRQKYPDLNEQELINFMNVTETMNH